MAKCQMCEGNFKQSGDALVMCAHHKGAVHYGCCADVCSQHGEPCDHAHAVFDKRI